jgi:hypothetical protein
MKPLKKYIMSWGWGITLSLIVIGIILWFWLLSCWGCTGKPWGNMNPIVWCGVGYHNYCVEWFYKNFTANEKHCKDNYWGTESDWVCYTTPECLKEYNFETPTPSNCEAYLRGGK